MSLSLVQVPLRKVLTPTININVGKEYAIAKGSKDNTYQVFPAQNVNNNQITISCNPPSRDIVVNKRAYFRASYEINFSGLAGANGRIIQPGLDAPRAFPIARTINTLQISINNDQYSNVLNQYWPAFIRYHNPLKMEMNNFTTTPSFLDQYQEYNDFLNPFFGGSAKNALGGYGETSMPEGARGGFSDLDIDLSVAPVAPGAPTTQKVTFTVTEPVFISPFNYSNEDEAGFIGVQNLSMTVSFSELISAIWSHNNSAAGASTISTTSAAILKDFAVLLNFQSLPMDVPVPDRSIYPYFEIVPYSSAAQTINSGASQTLVLNSVQLKTIPRRMYVFARENLNDLLFANGGVNKTDCFGVIENISLTFNNKVGLLSTATQQDLYNLSVANGCDMAWSQWSKYVGSVLAIDFSKDMSLNETDAAGIIGNFQLGLQARIRNTNSTRNINYVLWAVVVNEGVAQIVNGSMSHQVGVFNNSDVVNTPVDEKIKWKRTTDVYGGFLPMLANIARAALPVVAPLAKTALRAAPKVADVIETLGYGSGGVLLEGGRMMSRKQMKRRL
jgi:hypothetical protein